ncbi:MAG: isoamylase early set domain-containing protein [Nitrospirae bacterium]|nr:isoamylase early set domain-containing protein [Nitrospirota bacterium]
MDNDRELIHKLLDGGLPSDETAALMKRVNSDPDLLEEFTLLKEAVTVIEKSERKQASASFTSDVMRRLSSGAKAERKGWRNFFFGERIFRWNMAYAAAALLLAVLTAGGIYNFRSGGQIPYSALDKSAVTVKFNFYSPDAKSVSVAGDFNKWRTDAGVMRREEGGIWTIKIPLKPGAYNYMFVMNGDAWITDPEAAAYHDDGFGYKNSVVRVDKL